MIVSLYHLAIPNWTVVSVTPYAEIARRANAVLKPMLLSIAILITLGIAMVIFAFITNRKPLVKTMALLSADRGSGMLKEGLWHLNHAVYQLVSNNNLLARRLKASRMELRAALVASLESGDALEDAEIDALLSHVGIRPQGDRFRGVYLSLPHDTSVNGTTLERGDLHRALVLEILSPYAPVLSFLSLRDRHTYLLLYAPGDIPNDPSVFFHNVWQALQTAGLEPVFYLGMECRKLRYLPYSLWTAQRIMQGSGQESFLVYAEDDEDGNAYDYTELHEKKLATFAATGDEEHLIQLLETIYTSNVKDRCLSRLDRQMLVFRMIGTLGAVRGNMELDEELICSPHKLELDSFFNLLIAHYRRICLHNQERRTEHTSRLAAEVIAFIDANYADYALTLTSAAMQFGMTAKYLSVFMREKTGVNFSAYLESLRVRKANELLLSTKLTTDEIALKLGYANGKTFRRAYTRVTGITPTKYRQANIA